jgi:uncharacterized coiled-coil DUF342 family protein
MPMDINKEIHRLRSDVEFMRHENDHMHEMIKAISEQITFFHRQFEQVHKFQKRAVDREENNSAWIKDELLNIWTKLSPTFHKMFPGQAAVENQIDRIVKARPKNSSQ